MGKIPWRRKWQSILAFLPGKSHGQRSRAATVHGIAKELDMLATKQQQPSLWSNSHLHMTTGKTMVLTIQTFVDKVMSLLFNTLSRFVIAILPGSQHLLISWLWSPSAVILESKKLNLSLLPLFPLLFAWSDGTRCHDLRFLMLRFKPLFHSAISPSSRSSLVPLCFLPLEWYYLHFWDCWYSFWQSWFQLVIHPAWHFTWCNLHIS